MTDDEVQPYVGHAVRLTKSDGTILAGTLHAAGANDHGHTDYQVVSDPIQEGGQKVSVLIHGADLITQIVDASSDPAAVE